MADEDRRKFLKVATCAIGGSVGLAVAGPALTLLAGPAGKITVTTPTTPLDLGPAEQFRANDPPRKVDIVARYGGEEFVLLLPETNSEGGIIFAERLRERIELERFELEPGRVVNLTVSIGIATFPSPRIASTEDLFARADEALYRAKSDGRNQVRI